MGCGSSSEVVVLDGGERKPTPNPTIRRKTASISSSSSGVSSYRTSHISQPVSQDQSKAELQGQDPASRAGSGQPQTAETESEEERRHQEQARAEEEARRQEEARLQEEARRQEEARLQEEARRQEEARLQEEARRQQEASQAHIGALSQQGPSPGKGHQGGDRSFTPREIAEHNSEVGWVEWIPHKGKVYDGNRFRAYFSEYVKNREAMLEARKNERLAAGAAEEETEFVTFIDPLVFCISNPSASELWNYHGVLVLRVKRVSEEEIDKEIPPFSLGTITGRSGPEYFDDFRRDVSMLVDDLQSPYDEEKSPAQEEYLAQLMRWQTKYKEIDPPEQSPISEGTDPNEQSFPLPVDPESLRLILLEWEPFDLDIPSEGAWVRMEPEEIDLGDPHEIFTSSLRDNFATEDLLFDIEGEAAWEELPVDVIKEEVMTPEQEEIQAARDKRTDLDDLDRMKRRREELCNYFIETRELAPDIVMPFLQWASLLEASQTQLDKLC